MLSTNRDFHYKSELILSKSRFFSELFLPKDDTTNWLFLSVNDKLYSFVYKIDEPLSAKYDEPFNADVAFTAIEYLHNTLELNVSYELFRHNEPVGFIKLLQKLDK